MQAAETRTPPLSRRRSTWMRGCIATASLLIAPVQAQPDTPVVQAGPDATIDLKANQTRLADILTQLADSTTRNIVIGAGVDDKRVTVSVRDMTLTQILDAILPGAGCRYQDRGQYIIVDSAENLLIKEVAAAPTVVEVIHLQYVSAKSVVGMVTPLLSPAGKIVASPASDVGIESSDTDTGGDSPAGSDVIIIEDTQPRLDAIRKVIESIDVRPTQVLIEATVLRAALNDENQLGVDLNFLSGVDFQGIGATSLGGLNLEPGQVPAAEFDAGVGAVATALGGPTDGAGFTFGIIKNNVAVFIRALEELTDTVVLANPKILALNKQRGEVIVGRRDGYVTTTVTETAAVQSVEFLETGTQLTYRPFVLSNGQVRMEVHVEDSAGGLTPSDLPFENTTEATSNIILEDGHTILIGGLFRNSDDVSRSQIPGLGEVPGFGALFRRSRDSSQREEVMVLLTVHVIADRERFHELGDQMREEAEGVRLGLRERLQWFGRQRLSEAHLRSAAEQLNAGQRDKALFHTRMALASDPWSSTGRRLRDQLDHGRDAMGPNLELREWVTRQLNGRPSGDAIGPNPEHDGSPTTPTGGDADTDAEHERP